MEILKCLLAAVAAYILGSLNMSILLSRALPGGDVRKKGSGNAGATNMARVYGLTAGLTTLAGDILKSLLAMGLGLYLAGDLGLMAAGVACMAGHCFPVFHHFKGGKGVSVGAAIGLMVDWRVFLFIAAVFLLAALLTKKVSFGSLCAALAITAAALAFRVSTPRLILAIFGMCVVVFQHRPNIRRLAAGTEPDFKAAKESRDGRKKA